MILHDLEFVGTGRNSRVGLGPQAILQFQIVAEIGGIPHGSAQIRRTCHSIGAGLGCSSPGAGGIVPVALIHRKINIIGDRCSQICSLIPLAIPAQCAAGRIHAGKDQAGVSGRDRTLVIAVGIRSGELHPAVAAAKIISGKPGIALSPVAVGQQVNRGAGSLSHRGHGQHAQHQHQCQSDGQEFLHSFHMYTSVLSQSYTLRIYNINIHDSSVKGNH